MSRSPEQFTARTKGGLRVNQLKVLTLRMYSRDSFELLVAWVVAAGRRAEGEEERCGYGSPEVRRNEPDAGVDKGETTLLLTRQAPGFAPHSVTVLQSRYRTNRRSQKSCSRRFNRHLQCPDLLVEVSDP